MGAQSWLLLPCVPKVAVRDALRAESEGWDGVMLADSQNLAAELVVELALIAAATTTLRFAPGVTNPVTRHPAVLAGAMATLQAESGGRAAISIGRGDSALAHLGCAPASVAAFEAYVRALRGYLRGQEVPFDRGFVADHVRPVDTLDLAAAPEGSTLRWLRPEVPRVPVGVAATGPRVIRLAALHGDAVDLSVGADPGRVKWAIEQARSARQEAGLDPDGLDFGAYINIGVHPDAVIARSLIAGGLSSFSRFSAMHGTVTGGAKAEDEQILRRLHASYDMTGHGNAAASHTSVLTDDFADRNAICGPAEHCADRLRHLYELGVRRFLFMAPFSRDGEAGVAHRHLVDGVLPEVARWS